MGDYNNGFFFFWGTGDNITILTFFFWQEKIKLKSMLFQNLYDDILVRQKLKTKKKKKKSSY